MVFARREQFIRHLDITDAEDLVQTAVLRSLESGIEYVSPRQATA